MGLDVTVLRSLTKVAAGVVFRRSRDGGRPGQIRRRGAKSVSREQRLMDEKPDNETNAREPRTEKPKRRRVHVRFLEDALVSECPGF
jgi:hypothetical protein